MTTAFVLSGGGSLGAIQVGQLRALAERGIEPDLILGASVGTLNGGYVALHPGLAGVDGLEALWQSVHSWDVFPPRPLETTLAVLGLRDAVTSSGPLNSLLRRELGEIALEELAIPLHVVTTDVLTGRSVVLSRGVAAAEAALASAAIPGVFPPVRIGAHALVDGGFSDNTPVDEAVRLGADRVYVLPTGFACALSEPPRSALAALVHALSVAVEQRIINDVAAYEEQVELVVLPPPCPLTVLPVDFSQTNTLIRRGYELAKGRLRRRSPIRHQAEMLRRTHRRHAAPR